MCVDIDTGIDTERHRYGLYYPWFQASTGGLGTHHCRQEGATVEPSGYFTNILIFPCYPLKPDHLYCLLGFYKNSIWPRHIITSKMQPEVTQKAK